MIRLHELREKRGLSMMDTAKSLDMPYTTYVNYEKGTREPNIEALFRLADFFEVTIDELLERCAPNEPLTLDELREMDGEPVWVKCLKPDKYTYPPVGWRILETAITGNFGVWNGDCALIERDYGTDWLAYRRPPEGGIAR